MLPFITSLFVCLFGHFLPLICYNVLVICPRGSPLVPRFNFHGYGNCSYSATRDGCCQRCANSSCTYYCTSLPVLCVRVCIDLRLFSFVYRWPLRVATVARHPSCVPCSLTTGTLWTCFIITITTATLLSPTDTGHRSLGVVRTVVATSPVFPFLFFPCFLFFIFSKHSPPCGFLCCIFPVGHRSSVIVVISNNQ